VRRLATDRWFRLVPAASLAALRIAFGLVLVWEVQRYLRYGWITRYWVEPTFHLPYEYLEGLRPLPEPWLHVLFAALAVCGLAIAAGVAVRVAAAAVALGLGYLFLLDAARYLNHLYLVLLLAALFAVVPSDGAAALGPWLRRRLGGREAPPAKAPAWALWTMRFQVAVPYVFGGVAKLNGDWLRGEPIRDWLARRDDVPVIGPWLREEAVVGLFAYGGLGLDLLAPFAVAWRRTRVPALAAVLTFHLLNAHLFSIGIFPFLMIAASLVFLPADWPTRAWRRARRAPWGHLAAAAAGAGLAYLADPVPDVVPLALTAVALAVTVGEAGLGRRPGDDAESGAAAAAPPSRRRRTAVVAFVATWIAVQTVVPLRHHLLPGDVAWNEAGHRYSWRMKLRSKSGDVTFVVTPPDGSWTVRSTFEDELADWQRSWVATRPYLTLSFAHHIAGRFAEVEVPGVSVRAEGTVSLNGRPARPLIDPTVDLAALPRRAPTHASWVLPLREPLPPRP
jgi:hypothetical protein